VKKKFKIVIFGDLNNVICRILTWHLLKISKKNNIQIVKLINTAKEKDNLILNIIEFFLIKLFNLDKINPFFNNKGIFLKLFSKLKIQYVKNINDSNFVTDLRKNNYDYAFSICCNQIFKKKLISSFYRIINYHSSLLPKYKGLNSTLWSILFREKFTGYSFHYVDGKIDNGNIILQEKFKINYSYPYKKIEIFKTFLAKNSLQKVVSRMLKNFDGNKQRNNGSYYGKKEIKKLITFKKIKNIQKIIKIIDIWGGIVLIKENKKYYITKVSNKGKILRISHYPVFIFKIMTIIKKCQTVFG
jgi:folate-dependent phosphoribosylglycinamide formyltransferase PurN